MRLTATLMDCEPLEIYKPLPEAGSGEALVSVQAGTVAGAGKVQVNATNGGTTGTDVAVGKGKAVAVKASKTVHLHLKDGPPQLEVEYEVTTR